MHSIAELNYGELEHFLVDSGERIFHARQIFSWIYDKGAVSFEAMSDISAPLRDRMKREFTIFDLRLVKAAKSKDRAEKLLFSLSDGELIEAVIIPERERITACITSQAGCKYKCIFCASGISGFKRNLSCGEIMQEVLFLSRHLRPKKITHIVFMGTGEPLDNYDAVLKAVRIINSKEALNIGARRITLSTSGIIPGIKRLADEGLQVELSISLHAADDKVRSTIMPVNKIFPLKDLIAACSDYIKKTNRQITFEYVLIKGLNSGPDAAKKLALLLKPLRLVKVNLIPANPVRELRIEPPVKSEILAFKSYLAKQGMAVTLRRGRGEDIEAACGQLRLRHARH